MKKQKVELIVERGANALHGRVHYNDNLIIDEAGNLHELEEKLKKLLYDFEQIEPASVDFEHTYDIYALFEKFDFLNISKIAKYAGINPGLLRQYASGVKHPSLIQAKKIETTIHKLADQMQRTFVYAE